MTPLLMTEATTTRGGPAVPASDETAPKGDGGFADLVDAPATQDEQLAEPAEVPLQASEVADEEPDVALAVMQPDVPLPVERAVRTAVPDSPRGQVAEVAEVAKDVVKITDVAKEVGPPILKTDAEPDEKSLDAKPAGQSDKGTSAAKSAVQAIMLGRTPQPQADALQKPVPLPTDAGTLPDEVEPVTAQRGPTPIIADKALQSIARQAPITGHVVAVPTEAKPMRDVERREASIELTQQPTDVAKQLIGPPTPVVNTPVLASAPTIMLDLQKQAANQTVAEVDLASGTGLGERAGTSGAHTIATGPSPTTAQAGQQVAHQIASAITQSGGRATEIALNPEELGRVRLSMTAQETTITLTVLAERPETTDLLRRNIDALAQEFRALGYDNINFSFGGDGAAQTDTDDASDQSTLTAEAVDDNITSTAQQPTTGLDLRM